jgi:hypothetical protein
MVWRWKRLGPSSKGCGQKTAVATRATGTFVEKADLNVVAVFLEQ